MVPSGEALYISAESLFTKFVAESFSEVRILHIRLLGAARMAADGHGRARVRCAMVGSEHRGGRYVELDRDRIADIAQRHGVDEREALILYHLGHAFELYFEIAKEEDYGYDVNLQDWVDHHTGLINLLMRRVVRRDHPGGWRTGDEIIALREAERQSEADQT